MEYKKMNYNKNFITKVIFRIDFNVIPNLQSERQPEFSEKIKARYPNFESKQTAQIIFTASGSTTGIQQELKGWTWEHRNENKKRVVSLTSESLTIEYGDEEFTVFNDFATDVTEIYSIFHSLYKPSEVSRIGLRYIDEIVIPEGNPLEWKNLISDDLACAATAGLGNDMKLLRSMHQLQARRNDIAILFSYGIHNPDYPNPIARKHFILDTDCYIAEPTKADEVIRKFRELNDVAEYMFESSIKDGLREVMGVLV